MSTQGDIESIRLEIINEDPYVIAHEVSTGEVQLVDCGKYIDGSESEAESEYCSSKGDP